MLYRSLLTEGVSPGSGQVEALALGVVELHGDPFLKPLCLHDRFTLAGLRAEIKGKKGVLVSKVETE
jgi:hypothetical protein